MADTKQTGDRAEAQILAALVKRGDKVLIPFGDNFRYDLLIDNQDGTFSRVQCKSGVYREGCVRFKAHSTHHHRNGSPKTYVGGADLFGVYCHDLGTCYLVPVDSVVTTIPYLRVDPRRGKGGAASKYASSFEI